MILVDAHCHLDFFDEKEQEEIIGRAEKAGVKAIISNGVNRKSNESVLKIAKRFSIVKAALGMYPTDTHHVEEDIAFIRKHKKEIVAIGEVGMDFKESKEEEYVKRQQEMFRKIIALAKELDKPLIVHSRKAEKEVIDALKENGAKKVVMHCFSGKKKLIPLCIEQGWYFTIPTHVVKSEQMQHLTKEVPMNRILTETDAPYLSPYEGKKNEPRPP